MVLERVIRQLGRTVEQLVRVGVGRASFWDLVTVEGDVVGAAV